ncbi:hypothetical protein [Raoultella planticola]|uniref:hypothetical protein n=1 Tax=Raoultella planticola TaxID=575 RepID=UPI0035253AD0
MKVLSSARKCFLISSLLLSSFQVDASDSPIKVDANGEQLRAGTVSFPVWRYTITGIDNEVIINGEQVTLAPLLTPFK